MRFEPTRLAEYTDEALIDEIRRVAQVVGRSQLSTSDFKHNARVGLTTLRRRFGSWREALEVAGLGQLYIETFPARISRTRARGWTEDQVITELKRVAVLLGRHALTVNDFKKHATIGPDAVRARFGGWPQALRAAGLKSANHGKRYSDEACFENILVVWTHYGRQPKFGEMNKAPSTVGGKAYMVRWGTWNRAVHAFANHVESDNHEACTEDPSCVPIPAAQAIASTPKPEDRRDPSLGLRYHVLRRARFRCTLCGRSPATDPCCELHIDHILPFSKGGKTVLENLQVLCAACNLGKGNTVDPEENQRHVGETPDSASDI